MRAHTLSQPLFTTQQIYSIDRQAVASGTAGYQLMARAGQATLDRLRNRWPDLRKITLFCGTGNNGGDGYVLARLAHRSRIEVQILQLGEPATLKNEALQAHQDLIHSGLTPTAYTSSTTIEGEVIVDALLGIGLQRAPEGIWAEAIEAINHASVPVLSIDVPSGLDADRGVALNRAIIADHTLCMIALKQGLFTAEGPDHAGEIELADLGVSAQQFEQPSTRLLQAEQLPTLLPARKKSYHKGNAGHLLVVGGSAGMSGAVRIAAEGALRSGAGLVTIATHPDHASFLNINRPELMVHGINHVDQLKPLLNKASAIVVGPGLGQGIWGQQILEQILEYSLPTLIDADGLNLLARKPDITTQENWLLTPHPGEAARLLQQECSAIQENRFEAVRALQSHYGGTTILKGNGTLIRNPAGNNWLSPLGNPGMATAGMGDLLSGIIGGFLAQGLTTEEASIAGVLTHAMAGDYAATEGERGMVTSDLLPWIRKIVNPAKIAV